MKHQLYLIILVFLVFACGQNSVPHNDESIELTDTIKFKKVVLSIEGMTCEGCELTIQESVKQIEGIQQVKASHARAQATIIFDTAVSNIVVISENINNLGYSVTGEL